MKSSNIGGQAVLEGIMMRNGGRYSVAVRKPDGDIEVDIRQYKSIIPWKTPLKIPFIRGIFNFVDSLVLGMKTLTFSASFFEEEEEELLTEAEAKKREKNEKIMMNLTVVLSVIIAAGLFMVLPYYLSGLVKHYTDSRMVMTVCEGLIRVGLFLLYIALISRMKDIQRTFMYHGAEHKCINCIEHGLELNVENVRKSSRQHKRCGTSFLFFVMIVSIIFCFFITAQSQIARVLIANGAGLGDTDAYLGQTNYDVSTAGEGLTLQIGANEGQTMSLNIGDMSATALGVSGNSINIATQDGASKATTVIDDAIKKVSAQRSSLGAVQNRLEHTISNLDTSSENLQTAESRIRDVDMAEEMVEYSKNNILQQAAQSMLAQANQSTQGVLSLLQ